MEKDKESIGFVKGLTMGVFFGAAAGTIIGLLFAPRKGSETQHAVADNIQDLLSQVGSLSAAGGMTPTRMGDIENDAKIRSQAIIDKARNEAKELIDEANSILKEIKEQKPKEDSTEQ